MKRLHVLKNSDGNRVITSKVILLGDLSVGKTTLIQAYVNQGHLDKKIAPTIGAAFATCNVHVENTIVKCEIWDTGGQERFRALVPMYYRNANAAILVFDVTSLLSFENIKRWVDTLKKDILEPMTFIVVGNKIDLTEDRKISRCEGVQYSNQIGAAYYECSALQYRGIEQVLNGLAIGVMRLYNVDRSETTEDALYAKSSDQSPTDTAVEELTQLSNNALAHGTERKCCF